MIEVTDAKFEAMVAAGIDAIPEQFASKMANIAVTWAEAPDFWQRMKARLSPGRLLLGLYEGVPKTRRGNYYSGALPDKITIFKRPLELLAADEQHLAKLVRDTVWHEVAHHFGLSDREIQARQRP